VLGATLQSISARKQKPQRVFEGHTRLKLSLSFEEAPSDLLKVKPPEKGEKKPK
jgi:hypothetical protein